MLTGGGRAHRPRYLVTDLDGTLLRSDASVSDLTVDVVTRALRARQVVSFATARDHVWHTAPLRHGPRHFKESRLHDPRFAVPDPLRIVPGDQVIMLTYIADESQIAVLHDRARETFAGHVHIHATRDTHLPDFWFLELSHPHANKAAALQAWASLVGCEAGMVTVFGDNLNDLGLFAAGNAHRELQSLADEVIASNDEDAVAQYLARHL